MAIGASSRETSKNIRNWVNLVCAALLFVSPWLLGFSEQAAPARTAWIGGAAIAVVAVVALARFAEWENWATLIVGLAVAIAPWVLDFTTIHAALAASAILGLIVALASISEIWVVHCPAMTAR